MSQEDDKISIKMQGKMSELKNQEDLEDQNDDDQGNSCMMPDGDENPEGGSQQIIKKRNNRKLDISNFIMKTYKILEDRKNTHIIEWTEGGSCFIVKNKDLFEN